MANLVVIGIQWGDEGKGKIVDLLTPRVDIVTRFQGGANAGHTLVIGGEKTILHLIPSGVLHRHVKCVIGNGVVLDPEVCLDEIATLKSHGLLKDDSQLIISERAHVVFLYHKLIDKLREEKLAEGRKIGTTGRGIGPAYEDKSSRTGIRCAELVREDILRDRLGRTVSQKNEYISRVLGGEPLDEEAIIEKYVALGKRLGPYVANTQRLMNKWIKEGKNILFEGAQGSALDIDHGTFPFVTSSNTVAAEASIGTGVGPRALDHILGVAKAYCTRVGGGPFMTELTDATGDYLRKKGGEFGATTGRPRRCGWIDLVYLKYTTGVNDVTALALTKLDVLSGLDNIKLCTGYDYKGSTIDYVPSLAEDLEYVKPKYKEVKGWKGELDNAREWKDIPGRARDYIKFIEDYLEVPVALVSTGPERDANIIREELF